MGWVEQRGSMAPPLHWQPTTCWCHMAHTTWHIGTIIGTIIGNTIVGTIGIMVIWNSIHWSHHPDYTEQWSWYETTMLMLWLRINIWQKVKGTTSPAWHLYSEQVWSLAGRSHLHLIWSWSHHRGWLHSFMVYLHVASQIAHNEKDMIALVAHKV